MMIAKAMWEALLQLCSSPAQPNIQSWSYSAGHFFPTAAPSDATAPEEQARLFTTTAAAELPPGWTQITLPYLGLQLACAPDLPTDIRQGLQLYWPLAIIKSLPRECPFVLLHMAVSLDGKIATLSGDSKWIGNKENLIHAHRLRALADGILVGATTVENDSPTLSVRRVSGKNPTRFILSDQRSCFNNLQPVDDTKTYLLRSARQPETDPPPGFDALLHYQNNDEMMARIRQQKVGVLLVEGGALTASQFLGQGLVDTLQFHFSPIIVGSGKSIERQPAIEGIADAAQLQHPLWNPVGDSYMVTGQC